MGSAGNNWGVDNNKKVHTESRNEMGSAGNNWGVDNNKK